MACVVLISVVVVWLLLMPLVPTIARQTMLRFHLRSHSFAQWAIQFPIPSMYNFANQYEVRATPPGLIDPLADDTQPRYINHFPPRLVTFFDTRERLLRDGTDRWLTLQSSYRGQRIRTLLHAEPKQGNAGFELHRLKCPEPHR
jgi:hypothetical protein